MPCATCGTYFYLSERLGSFSPAAISEVWNWMGFLSRVSAGTPVKTNTEATSRLLTSALLLKSDGLTVYQRVQKQLAFDKFENAEKYFTRKHYFWLTVLSGSNGCFRWHAGHGAVLTAPSDPPGARAAPRKCAGAFRASSTLSALTSTRAEHGEIMC